MRQWLPSNQLKINIKILLPSPILFNSLDDKRVIYLIWPNLGVFEHNVHVPIPSARGESKGRR